MKLPQKVLITALFVVLATFAVPAWAKKLLSQSAEVLIPSIDSYGNPSWQAPGKGQGKLYKDEHVGIIVGSFVGKVFNKAGRHVVVKDQGYPFEDPWTRKKVVSTNDIEVVLKGVSKHEVAPAHLIVCYDPSTKIP
jgi:hypothetical protein